MLATMIYPKGSLTTSSDSQSPRGSSRITTLCHALPILSWCMSWLRCHGTWPWTSRQLKSFKGMPGMHWRRQWRSPPSGSRILRLSRITFLPDFLILSSTQLLLKKSEGSFDLIFSLTPPPNVEHLGIELPAPAFRPLDECFQKLQDAVNNGTFDIFVRLLFVIQIFLFYLIS